MGSSHAEGQERAALAPLTALRFAAALLVFAWHCGPTRKIAAAFSFGYLGVGFFFLLSGFILTYMYEERFRGGLRPAALRAFYAARVARIYPLHLAALPLAIAALVRLGPNPLWSGVAPHVRLEAVAAQVLLVQSWIPVSAIYFGANGPAWSISVEAFFYLFFPPLVYGASRALGNARPATVVFVAAGLWATYATALAPQHALVDDWRWYVFPPARAIDFVVGLLLGIAFLRGAHRARRGLRPTSLEILAVAAVGLAAYTSALAPLALRFSAWMMPAFGFAIVVFAQGRGAFSRALAHPAAVRLGEISFAFYLCHLAVLSLVEATLGPRHPLFVPAALALTVGVSFALYHGVEQPLRVRVRALLTAREVRFRGPRIDALAVRADG